MCTLSQLNSNYNETTVVDLLSSHITKDFELLTDLAWIANEYTMHSTSIATEN